MKMPDSSSIFQGVPLYKHCSLVAVFKGKEKALIHF